MDYSEQTAAFCGDLERLIDRYGKEFDLTYATVIGVLNLALARIVEDALNMEKET